MTSACALTEDVCRDLDFDELHTLFARLLQRPEMNLFDPSFGRDNLRSRSQRVWCWTISTGGSKAFYHKVTAADVGR